MALRILLATSINWPTSALLAERLIRNGCQVSAVCPRGHVLEKVRGIETIFAYRLRDSLGALREALLQSNPDYVIPCSDGTVWQMHALYERCPEVRPLLARSLGAPESFPIVRSRYAVLETARRIGVRTPRTQAIHCAKDLDFWFSQNGKNSQAVLKADGTWGGSGVKIVSAQQEAVAAFDALVRRCGAIDRLKRIFVDRDAMVLWSRSTSGDPGICIQEFLPGRPANSMIACRDGKVLAALHVEVQTAMGATKAALSVRRMQHPEMARAAELLAAELKLNGLFGLDYIYDPASDRTWLLELNPRATQIGHLEWLDSGHSLGDIIAAAWAGGSISQPEKPISPEALVLLFPQASFCEPNSPWLRGGVRDLPTGSPELMPHFEHRSSTFVTLIQRFSRLFAKGDPADPVVFTDSGMVRAALYPPVQESWLSNSSSSSPAVKLTRG